MRVLNWIDRHAAVFIVIGLIGLGYLGVGLYDQQHGLTRTQAQLRRDETDTCMIQARGLPASKHLAAAMGDLAIVLGVLTPQQLDKTPKQIRAALEGLRVESAAYQAIEAQQPKGAAAARRPG